MDHPNRQDRSTPRQEAVVRPPRPALFSGIRDKLIGIFVVIKVLPLIALAVFAIRQIGQLGNTFKEKSSEIIDNSRNLVSETGALASQSSIAALDLKSRESIERLTTDIAAAVADFLRGRDVDILQAALLPRTESAYRSFLSFKQKEVVYHQDWVLSADRSRWTPATPPERSIHQVQPGSADNAKDFHYRPPDHAHRSQMQPLYHEMTFVGLDGRETMKISLTGLLPHELRDVSKKENTWCRAETYFGELEKLRAGEVYVSRVIGPYLPSPIIGPYTPEQAEKAGTPFAPEEAAYAGKENPVGKRFQGLIRWAAPVFQGGEKVGYVTLALDHTHLMEFTDHAVPTAERFSDISDAGEGNYAFLWDDQGRNISHPRDYFIVGYDPQTGEQVLPWISAELHDLWREGNGSFAAFEQTAPSFQEQTINKQPVAAFTKQGFLGLDCRYLNFAPQCIGWFNLTQHGGSGSFLILWSGLWKLTTAAAIPYHTSIYGQSPRGFGFVTIGANVDEFHSSATETAARIKAISEKYETDLEATQRDTLSLIQRRLQDTIRNLNVSTGIMIVLVILIAVWMASTLTGKITAIMAGIREFQAGRLSSRLAVASRDELGELARAFNEMADQLQRSINEMREARERAEASERAKSLFLANMSHEIRTPMNAIMGMTHLAMQATTEEERQRYLGIVHQSADSLLGLLNNVLDSSRMEAGQLTLNEYAFDLRRLLDEVVAIMHAPAAKKGLLLQATADQRLTDAFVGDHLRLRQILLNLVDNAIKFTPAGSITITAGPDGDPSASGTDVVHFTVLDTGIGIVPEHRDTIFNRFEQADNSHTREHGGVGLGLSICKQLIELMGGRIWLESLEQGGSAFHCTLPLSPAEAEDPLQVVADEQPEAHPFKKLRILLVDDNDLNRDVARMVLEQDHKIATANTGLEALRALAYGEFDLVLMDVQMPEMDGLTATMVLRAVEQGAPLPPVHLPDDLERRLTERRCGRHLLVVAMTAHALKEDEDRCLAAGMDAYISKPFKVQGLKAVLMSLQSALPVEKQEIADEPKVLEEGTMAQLVCAIKELSGLADDQVADLVQAACASLGGLMTKAELAQAEGRLEDLARVAHTLKGTLLQCGLNRLAGQAQVIHDQARNSEDHPYAEALRGMRHDLRHLLG